MMLATDAATTWVDVSALATRFSRLVAMDKFSVCSERAPWQSPVYTTDKSDRRFAKNCYWVSPQSTHVQEAVVTL